MILYSLACGAGHRFDSWFRNSTAYDEQRSQTLVSCPRCGSTDVMKSVMAPAVLGPRQIAAEAEPAKETPQKPEKPVEVALLDERSVELRRLLKSVREKVILEGHDVGARFPDEARRMHDGETPVRQIYGQASVDEARDLLEDGIMILPLPSLPEDLN